MSQHDMVIDNQNFPATRTDLNNALAALATLSSGATAPTTTYAFMLWLDNSTSPAVLKMRNSGNTAWVSVAKIDSSNNILSGLGSSITIDNAGNVGVGVGTPAAQLDVVGLVHLLYNAPSTRPASDATGGVSVTTNYSNGNFEAGFWNVRDNANVSFTFRQKTGASSHTDLASLGTGGTTFGSPTGGAQGAGTVNAQGLFVNGVSVSALGGSVNRIINGEMLIDQRNSGGSIAVGGSNTNLVDRFAGLRSGGSATLTAQQVDSPSPTAAMTHKKSLKFTVGTGAAPGSGDASYFLQRIEGLNVADLQWGTAQAKSVTLSFWVYASVTGTYAVSLINSASNRSYISTYTINAANTWEQKTITVPGDTSGTWLADNGIGIAVVWGLGSGSSFQSTSGSWLASGAHDTSGTTKIISTAAATFHITGVQLEAGSTATSFARRPIGQEQSLCERYYEVGTQPYYWFSALQSSGGTAGYGSVQFRTRKRAAPSMGVSGWQYLSAGTPTSYTPSGISQNVDRFTFQCTSATNYSGEFGAGSWFANSEL